MLHRTLISTVAAVAAMVGSMGALYAAEPSNVASPQEVVKNPVVAPEFPGGQTALIRFIADNLRYPKEAQAAGDQGMVIVQFAIGADGKVGDIKVIRGVTPALDAEAVRIVKELPMWQPARDDKDKAVPSVMTLPIKFSLQ